MKVNDERRSASRTPARGKSIVGGIALVILVVGYVLLRPTIERQFGIELPSLLDDDEHAGTANKTAKEKTAQEYDEAADLPAAESRDRDSELPGGLRDIGGDVYESSAGLLYTPGSFEGHRLKHLLRHARDDPDRPIHGVFEGGDDAIIKVIDEAYRRTRDGGRGVSTERDGPRTIHEVDFNRRIGFIGGQSGKRRGFPAATGLRLVLEDRRVITAFPIQP